MRVSPLHHRFGQEQNFLFLIANVIHYNTAVGKSQPMIDLKHLSSANDVPVPHVRTKRFRDDDRTIFLLVIFQNGGDRPSNGQSRAV